MLLEVTTVAHYRKLTIGDLTFEYNIGKTFVVIKHESKTNDLVEKSKIGFNCVGDIIITPKMVKDYLCGQRNNPAHYFPTCNHVGVDKTLRYKPYDAEIHNEYIPVYWCEYCFNQNGDEM